MPRRIIDRILSLNEAADLMDLSAPRMRQFVDEGRLPATKVGKTWAVLESRLMEFAAKERLPGRPRVYEVILVPGEGTAHVSQSGGHRTACGREFLGGFIHRLGQEPGPMGTHWCAKCKGLVPRYFVRQFSREGISG